jgi:hypothetical protein
MKVTNVLQLLLIMVLCTIAGQSAAQEDMRLVDNSVFAKTTRTAAVFEHDQHNEISGIDDCIECHHVYKDGKRSEDESSEDLRCADCHDGSKEGPALSLRKAYHQNCKGCHLERKTGPILCGQCQKKK